MVCLVVVVGVEPTQPEAPDLQSGGLTDAQHYHFCLATAKLVRLETIIVVIFVKA